MATEAHSRGRAGVGQAEGLEQQERQVSTVRLRTGGLVGHPTWEYAQGPSASAVPRRWSQGGRDADPSSAPVLAETSEGTPLGHTAAKQSTGTTNSAGPRQSLPCGVRFLRSLTFQRDAGLPRTTGIFPTVPPTSQPPQPLLFQGQLCSWPGQQDPVAPRDDLWPAMSSSFLSP